MAAGSAALWATGDTRPVDWLERARAAEQAHDWDVAITLVSAHAECFSDDPDMHDNHLWHMDLLARAERIPELTERALTDNHARRRLNGVDEDKSDGAPPVIPTPPDSSTGCDTAPSRKPPVSPTRSPTWEVCRQHSTISTSASRSACPRSWLSSSRLRPCFCSWRSAPRPSPSAAYGLLTAVFSWGWGTALVGLEGPVPIPGHVPPPHARRPPRPVDGLPGLPPPCGTRGSHAPATPGALSSMA